MLNNSIISGMLVLQLLTPKTPVIPYNDPFYIKHHATINMNTITHSQKYYLEQYKKYNYDRNKIPPRLIVMIEQTLYDLGLEVWKI